MGNFIFANRMGQSGSKGLMEEHFLRMKSDPDYAKVDLDMLAANPNCTIAECHSSEYIKATSALFEILDADSSGFLDGKELPELAKELLKVYKKITKSSLANDKVQSIICANDFDEDNKLSYEEFSGIMDDVNEQMQKCVKKK